MAMMKNLFSSGIIGCRTQKSTFNATMFAALILVLQKMDYWRHIDFRARKHS
jgi:hypothetical protein